MGDLVGLAVGLAVGLSVGVDVVGLDVFGFAIGFKINPDSRLGFGLSFRIGDLVGGLGSPLIQAPLNCPPNEPLQHNN